MRALVKTRAWEGECAMVVRLPFLPFPSFLSSISLTLHSRSQFCNVASPPGAPKAVGPENEEGRIGCSQVCVPFKGTIGAAKTHEEEVVVVDVDLGVLKVRFILLSSCFRVDRERTRLTTLLFAPRRTPAPSMASPVTCSDSSETRRGGRKCFPAGSGRNS